MAAVPDLVERASPSVVTIFTDGGLGSGVVYRADGVLVTNEHVVRGATQVEVGFADGTRVPGTVRATDRTTDLAVVQVARNGLPMPRYADQLPRPGELAVAIGSPLGLENTVSAGVVSGVGREVPGASTRGAQQLVDLIQTDTAISPGNSGGALLDATGSVIGINEAYLPPASGAVSIGFAIPSTRVVDVVDQLLVDGTADHPYLGVAVQPLTGALRDLLGVAAQRGAVVLDVAPAGPAAGAGIRPGDVITRVGSSEIATVGELLGALRGTRPGQQVPVVVQRGPQSTTLTVTIGQAPG
ncbi:S1C family serine protease [Actinomycetospora rhizophila]|uniref:S1C family serine protease n=1 Tax=Actinomycetospora rhizophila TaxID=1416876 RepID=A0ABV9ZCU2_9PSEU